MGSHTSGTGFLESMGLLAICLFLTSLSLMIGGCRSYDAPVVGKSRIRTAGRSASSNVVNVAVQDQGVILRPGLVISVSVIVSGKKDIDETSKRISDNGTIVLPHLGTISTKGHTLDSLTKELLAQYTEYYVDPQVVVDFVRDSNSEGISPWGYVTVLGRVKNPGRIAVPATRDMTVSAAIQKAGGFNTSAKNDAIRVTRRGSDGKVKSKVVNLNAVGADGKIEDDILVESDDVVFVPERTF